jgi:predicted RNA binding protein YcfA (HicA-like mRNA interferase family)
MARKKKPSGRLSSGPWTFADFEKALKADGWYPVGVGEHPNYRHPTRPGKVQLDKKWTGVKKGHLPFRGVAIQGGYSKKELQVLLNR